MYFIEESKGKAIVVETIHTYLRSESCGSGKFQVSLLLDSKGRNPKEAYAWVLLLYRIANYKDFAEFTREHLPLGPFLVKILFYEFS